MADTRLRRRRRAHARGLEFYCEVIDAGVIQLREGGHSKYALVASQMNENADVRMRVLTWLAQADYYREVLDQDVLFFVDGIVLFFEDVRGGNGELLQDSEPQASILIYDDLLSIKGGAGVFRNLPLE